MKTLFVAIAAVFLTAGTSASARAPGKAPLGLEWGLSQDETKKLGVELGSGSDDSFGKGVALSRLPQAIGDSEVVHGSYGYKTSCFGSSL